jgi:tRNA threonylcarbamoyladenosine biosynthesis protein TsaE
MSESDRTFSIARSVGAPQVPRRTISRAPAQTAALADQIAAHLGRSDVLLLIGDLGTGKTTFTQALAAALGIDEPVTSPTFTIMRHYVTRDQHTLLHIDAYRLRGPAELSDLGIDELLDDGAMAVIEWGDIVAAAVGPDHLDVHLTWVDETVREIRVEPVGARWCDAVSPEPEALEK